MKKLSKIFLSLFLVTFFFPVAKIKATAEGPESFCVKGIPTQRFLNLRKSPSMNAEVIAKIPHNACNLENLVVMVDINGRPIPETDNPPIGFPRPFWFKVRFNGVQGWVAMQYLIEAKSSD